MSLAANAKLSSDELKTKLLELDDEESGEALFTIKEKHNKNKKKKFQEKRHCYNFNSPSHLRNECPEVDPKEASKSSGKANNVFCAKNTQSVWYIPSDSGASRHMTPYGNILSGKKECETLLRPK